MISSLPSPMEFLAELGPALALARTVLDLDARHHQIPRDRDIILYCSCPNEATSAKVAMQLERKGIRNVRLLEGGYEAWVELGFEVETVELS